MSYPNTFEFYNILVTPMHHVLGAPIGESEHTGGPVWPEWRPDARYRFFRGGTALDRPPPEAQNACVRFTEQAVWIGPAHHHFGHMISEFCTRLFPALQAFPNHRLIFSAPRDQPIRCFDDAPRVLKELLAWYSIPQERIHIVNSPTVFTHLATVAQPETISSRYEDSPHPQYLAAIDEFISNKLGPTQPQGTFFISRSKMSARFAGEQYLDRVFRSIGISVFFPEEHRLEEQIKLYWSAERLIFSEGSAIHGLQLLGTNVADVIVLGRRPSRWWANMQAIKVRARRAEYIQIARNQFVPLGPTGKRMVWAALAEIDVTALRAGLQTWGIDIDSKWDSQEFEQACCRDLEDFAENVMPKWIKENKNSVHSVFDGLIWSRIANASRVGHLLVDDAPIFYRQARRRQQVRELRDRIVGLFGAKNAPRGKALVSAFARVLRSRAL